MRPAPKAQLSHIVAELQQPAASRLLIVEGEPAQRAQLASAVAAHLGRHLLQVSVGDDWRKRLAAISAGDQKGAILFFDEADSLFGKRGEVREAHDRYAALENSFTGLVIFGVTVADALLPDIRQSAKTLVAGHNL